MIPNCTALSELHADARLSRYPDPVSNRQRTFVLGLLLAVLVFAVSALPTQTKHVLHTQGVLHPWLHLCAFAVLAFLLLSSTRSDLMRVLFIVALLAFGYATEANESRKNGWAVETKDVQNDSIGVLLGAVAGLLCFPKNNPS